MYELYSMFMPDALSSIAYLPNLIALHVYYSLGTTRTSVRDLECYNCRVLCFMDSRSPYMYSPKGPRVLSVSKQNFYQLSLLNSHGVINF